MFQLDKGGVGMEPIDKTAYLVDGLELEHFHLRPEVRGLFEKTTPQDIALIRRRYRGIQGRLLFLFQGGITLLLMIVTLPVLLLSMFAILITSGRPVIYRQLRMGCDRRLFYVYKLRTMTTGSEDRIGGRLLCVEDQCVTGIGKLLRYTRIDELPQLWNVLRGEMSLVGPRPMRPALFENTLKKLPGHDIRFVVRPGITGVSQLFTPYDAPKDERLRYDILYILRWSLWVDLKIMWKTMLIICFRWLPGAFFKPLRKFYRDRRNSRQV